MTSRLLILVPLLACGAVSLSWPQSPSISENLAIKLQNYMLNKASMGINEITGHPDSSMGYLQDESHTDTERPLSNIYLSINSNRFLGLQKYELSRLECAARGLDMGATLGLFLGAIGTTSGLLKERDAWYLVGAMTTVGAILGGSVGAKNPKWRVRIRFEP